MLTGNTGEASPGPPNDLPIHITTLPMNLVYPPTHLTRALEQSSQASTRPLRLTSPLRQLHQTNLEEHKKIETPSWRIVKPGEDDKEEAREELAQSPVKRKIRHGHDLVSLLLHQSCTRILTWKIGIRGHFRHVLSHIASKVRSFRTKTTITREGETPIRAV